VVRDADLIAASLSDPEQFVGIFERHFEAIHRYAARRLGGAMADDLASQVFTIAFERRRSFDLTALDARPWLYGIASNLVRGHRRAEGRQLAAMSRLATEPIEAPGDGESDALLHRRERACMARALNRLDRRQRDVLLLYCWAGLSHAEIALALKIPPGTVASRLSRARQRVRAALEDDGIRTDRPTAVPVSKEER
jgi:RNA polymerase sigma-70 factor (ECF subfamily)